MALVVILFVVIVGLVVFYAAQIGLNNRKATKDANAAYKAAGMAVQALRELRRQTLTGSDQEFIINQTLADIESALLEKE